MIIAPTSCFFILRAEGEAAAHMMDLMSPSAAADIDAAILVSRDFDSDIAAVHGLDESIAQLRLQMPVHIDRVKIEEKYNPLYFPGTVDDVDEMLQTNERNDSARFIGMNGSPYVLKTIEIYDGEDSLISGKIEYRPFELPTYNDIVASRSQLLN
jgi:hypothetical protein